MAEQRRKGYKVGEKKKKVQKSGLIKRNGFAFWIWTYYSLVVWSWASSIKLFSLDLLSVNWNVHVHIVNIVYVSIIISWILLLALLEKVRKLNFDVSLHQPLCWGRSRKSKRILYIFSSQGACIPFWILYTFLSGIEAKLRYL